MNIEGNVHYIMIMKHVGKLVADRGISRDDAIDILESVTEEIGIRIEGLELFKDG